MFGCFLVKHEPSPEVARWLDLVGSCLCHDIELGDGDKAKQLPFRVVSGVLALGSAQTCLMRKWFLSKQIGFVSALHSFGSRKEVEPWADRVAQNG